MLYIRMLHHELEDGTNISFFARRDQLNRIPGCIINDSSECHPMIVKSSMLSCKKDFTKSNELGNSLSTSII
jgi:hypothetical protein